MKKIIKRTALFLLLTPFVLLLIGFVIYLLVGLYAVGGESTEHQVYLKEHMQEVQPGTTQEFKVFDEKFYTSKVFFLGEVHGYAMPQELDFELLRHLHNKTGLTRYLAEVDYSQAHFLNEYLRTGDEQLLQYVFQTWVDQGAQWANKDFYGKLQRIYTYNQSLPAEQRITMVGVDKIQDTNVTKRHLHELLQISYTAGADQTLDSLQHFATSEATEAGTLQAFAAFQYKRLSTDTAALPLPAATRTDVMHVLQNLAYQHGKVRRDSVMFLNLQHLTRVNGWENEQFYGMWGLFHALQNSVNNGFMPFAALLQKEASPFKGKVTSINILSVDGENMIPAGTMPPALNKGQAYISTTWVNNDGPMVFVNGIKDLKAVTRENTMTLFKLDAENSPYRTSSRLAKTKIFFPGQNIEADAKNPMITDACQYVVLLRNSKALTPIKATL